MTHIVPQNPFLVKFNKQQEERKAPTEYHFVGSTKKVKGHTLFTYNTISKVLKPADVQREVSIDIEGNPIYSTKTLQEKDCIYIQALNAENAKKKLIKMGYGL